VAGRVAAGLICPTADRNFHDTATISPENGHEVSASRRSEISGSICAAAFAANLNLFSCSQSSHIFSSDLLSSCGIADDELVGLRKYQEYVQLSSVASFPFFARDQIEMTLTEVSDETS